jgi:hypothetical protein
MTALTSSLKAAMCFSPVMEPSRGRLESTVSSPTQLSKPNSSPARSPLEKRKGYSNCRRIFTVLRMTHHHCQSTATIRVLSFLSPRGSSMLERNTSTFAITTVEICIDDNSQLLLHKHKHQCCRDPHKALTKDKNMEFTKAIWLMLIGGQLEVNLVLSDFSFENPDFLCLYEWPSSGYGSTPSMHACHSGFQAGYYVNYILIASLFVYLFSCSTERSKRGVCCIYGLSPVMWLQLGWCIISLRWWSFHTQMEMPLSGKCHSAGDATWVRMHAYKTFKDILRLPRI